MMSDTGSDHDDLRPSKSKESTSNTELSTDGAVSLFSTVLTNALEQQKVNLIKHFENQFIQPVKSTGVSTPDFVFKREGHRIQYLFNTERSDTISRIEKLIRSKSYVQALEVLAEEKETLRKRNKIVKIADKHGWDTVNEYLDSPLADDKDDAANLRSAIASASRKRKSSKPYDRPSNKPTESGNKFNAKNFFRGISQNSGFGENAGQSQNRSGKCFYCNQQGHFARYCPFKASPSATVSTAPKEQEKSQ
ncbi:unnamed protein product [Mytilus edulis]|uniref:CCHC-type domain-containing protein n=1 Tax=Mytilus edulis TaxID=6550 RepID=A0A8S3TC94_MYTED|nr:unnamed protein product [Mytilus edulis]